MQELGQLETKHGLLQLSETLDFLHNKARVLHRAISPEVRIYSCTILLLVSVEVYVTSGGFYVIPIND